MCRHWLYFGGVIKKLQVFVKIAYNSRLIDIIGIAMTYPACPKCNENYTYADGDLLICPMCSHEWKEGETSDELPVIKDAVGNVLADGDSVTVIKDLKVKGSSTPIKVGTKVKSIRLIYDAPDDHDIDCKIDGFGAMKLKSSVVKKA